MKPTDSFFVPFDKAAIADIPLPTKFTFPFYYEPHPLSLLAASQLQQHIETQLDSDHNFGLEDDKEGLAIGKMFGVLVVRNTAGELGYLSGFSGKLGEDNHYPGFVPPVFDILAEDGFFNPSMAALNQLNARLLALEENPDYLALEQIFEAEKELVETRLAFKRQQLKQDKDKRKVLRKAGKKELSPADFEALEYDLKTESLGQQFYYKRTVSFWKERLAETEAAVDVYLDEIKALRTQRKKDSAALQKRLFDQYTFLNQAKESKSLYEIFLPTINDIPPAGAGECAAPKLLQYAFLHDMQPIALAEFWWGESPKSEVRKHGYFYPSCKGKCHPILGHMLQGMDVDDNPMLQNPAEGKTISIVYEDDAIVLVNKPAEFFSVPGKTIDDSVLLRMKQRYPTATGPLVVHRLDMSTSGLMIIAKTKEVHKKLQYQFIKRTIKKRYVAILDGWVKGEEGFIDLPLRVDLDDRPRQLVCYEHGKNARTRWEVLERIEVDGRKQTRVYFYPITGRTHQLRVHAAHPEGLNFPIIGDDLYGKKEERLLLHAEWIELVHPITKIAMTFEIEPEF